MAAKVFDFKTEEIPKNEFRMSPQKYPIKNGVYFIVIHSRGQTVIQKIVLFQYQNITYVGYIIVNLNGKILKEFMYNNPPENIQKAIRTKFKSVPNDLNLIFTQ